MNDYLSGLVTFMLVLATGTLSCAGTDLKFDPALYRVDELRMPNGEIVKYKAYENIPYITNIEDEKCQKLNIFVPIDLKGRKDAEIPILMRNNVGGYMASPPGTPSAVDSTGRALKEGYVVCIPGARGNGSTSVTDGKTRYIGSAPAGLLDLKAAVRYLHYNDDLIPGNSNLIFTNGTSAGGAMSALQGITGNRPEYAEYLRRMGAAESSDSVYASICYCPITDLNHADMEYEWLYQVTDNGARKLDAVQTKISHELAAKCPAYIDSLNLQDSNGKPVTSANYMEYLKDFIIASAQKAIDAGCEIPDGIGIIRFKKPRPTFAQRLGSAPADGKMPEQNSGMENTDFIINLDWPKYLSWIASQRQLKLPPAFDAWGVLGREPTPENQLFGNIADEPANFTNFSLEKRTGNPDAIIAPDLEKRIALMNPMAFIENKTTDGAAKFWYIRHGAKDRDTSFLVPVNLATKLINAGYDVNFALPWNRPHSGDYDLDDLFKWIEKVQ